MSSQAKKYAVAMSGEHFVAAELLRRQLVASMTMGNAKCADVVVMNQATMKVVIVEVKSSPRDEWIVGNKLPLPSEQPWVFVQIKPDYSSPRYFVFTATELNDILRPQHEEYCKWYQRTKGKPFTGPGVIKLKLKQARYGENKWGKIIQQVS